MVIYDLGLFSWLCKANKGTLATWTTLKQTPGVLSTAWPLWPNPATRYLPRMKQRKFMYFLTGPFVPLLLRLESSLCTFDTFVVGCMICKYFCLVCGLYFHPKIFQSKIFKKSNISFCFFVECTFGVLSKSSSPVKSWRYSVFFYKFYSYTFYSDTMIHFELISV